MAMLGVVLFVWLCFGVLAGLIGARKGEGCLAFIIGVLLGPFGVLAALISSGDRKRCPVCMEQIHKFASRCPKCRADLGSPWQE